MSTERNTILVNTFVKSMEESVRFYADGEISEYDIKYLAEYTVNRLDFANEWQMHKGLGYFAKKAVANFKSSHTALHKQNRPISI